jgi:hypothetical protein
MQNQFRHLVFLIALFSSNFPDQAKSKGFETGKSLLDMCTQTEVIYETLCLGYISGVIDAYTDGNQSAYKYHICLSEGTSRKKMSEIVKKYLLEHPEMNSYDAAPSVYIAAGIEFPCENHVK